MKNILVIENNIVLREKICNSLKDEGYNTLSANDGISGLHIAIKQLPDLILCDIKIPHINGCDFYKIIQQIKTTSSIPFIFITAQGEKKDIREGMNLGADDYIINPLDYKELHSSIKTRFDKVERLQQKHDEDFHALINNPLTGVFVYSKNKFDFVNEKCANIFGLSPADFSNITFNNLITGSDKNNILEKMECCFSKIQDNLHVKFNAHHVKEEHEVKVEMFASIVSFKGVDSLIGYISECA
ncbi:MAG TPA: response regulator [Bacteroidales bacterium]|nr:response regulator [Bacteroidales bacterium]HPS16050.1 response regulator [Bacteroidales bacterium]